MERKKIDSKYTSAIYTTIAGTARYFYLRKTRFPKDKLTEAFEVVGLNAADNIKKIFYPIFSD